MTDEQIEDLGQYQSSDAYDVTQKRVLRFAEELTRNADVTEGAVNDLKQTFSHGELVELAVTVSVANLTNRINHAFDIPLEN